MFLFGERPKIGGMKLWPMSGGRIAILEEKGNALVTGSGEVSVSRFELFEAFFVAASGPEDLVEALGAGEDRWKDAVNLFSLGEAGDCLEEFGELMREEFERIRGSLAEPKKKAAKKRAKKSRGTVRNSG